MKTIDPVDLLFCGGGAWADRHNPSINRAPNRLRRLGSLRAARSGAGYLQRLTERLDTF